MLKLTSLYLKQRMVVAIRDEATAFLTANHDDESAHCHTSPLGGNGDVVGEWIFGHQQRRSRSQTVS
jgi:hypothetical protein